MSASAEDVFSIEHLGEKIFSYLPFEDKFRVRRVSKLFQQLSSEVLRNQKLFVLSDVWNMNSFEIFGYNLLNINDIELILQKCPNIERIDIDITFPTSVKNVFELIGNHIIVPQFQTLQKELIVNGICSDSDFIPLDTENPKPYITQFDEVFKNNSIVCKHLIELRLTSSREINMDYIQLYCKQMEVLIFLRDITTGVNGDIFKPLTDFKLLKQFVLRTRSIENFSVNYLSQKLIHLDLQILDEINDTFLQTIGYHLTQLKHLSLNSYDCEITSNGFKSLLNLSQLEVLELRTGLRTSFASIDTQIFEALNGFKLLKQLILRFKLNGFSAQYLIDCQKITHLELGYLDRISDTFLELIGNHLTKLEVLTVLSNESEITFKGINSLSKLKQVLKIRLYSICGNNSLNTTEIYESLCQIITNCNQISYISIYDIRIDDYRIKAMQQMPNEEQVITRLKQTFGYLMSTQESDDEHSDKE